jgi:hypothetical protein
MKYIAIKNDDSGKLAAVVVQDGKGKIWYTTATQWYLGVLAVTLANSRFYIERRNGERSIEKMEVKHDHPDFLEVLGTKIAVPYLVYVRGKVGIDVHTATDAIEKLWKMFSPVEHQEIKEADNV